MKAVAQKKHAKYSPSSIYRVMACAGSVKLSEGIPSRTSPAAEEGTKAHELMERLLKIEKFKMSEYPDFMRDDVLAFVKVVTESIKPTSELLVETKVDLTFVHPEVYGTADVSIVDLYDTLHVIDFKYGRGFVSEKRNPQLLTYLLGIAHLYNYDFADYATSIYQPRYKGRIMRTDHVTKKELLIFKDTLSAAIEAAEKPNAKLNRGDHCHFCPAKIKCPEISSKALADAKHDFDDELQKKASDLDINELHTLLDKARYLKLWIAEVEAHATELLSKGKKIQGFSLQPTRPSIKWRDETKLLKLIESNKLSKYLVESNIVSPATARKNLAKKFSDTELKKFLDLETISVSSGFKLTNTASDFELETED